MTTRCAGLAALALLTTAMNAPAAEPRGSDDSWIDSQLDAFVALYKQFHSHPELSFREVHTAARLAEELRSAGADVTTGVGRLGIVGVLKNGAGPTVLVRSDMDALPIVEETGLPYASKVRANDPTGKEVGVMHACGHDVHMTCLVGTARWLAAHKDRWSGTVVLIGQPAEETVGGADAMLKDGLYSRFPRPDFALALHVTHDQPAGEIGCTAGPALAGASAIDVIIRGRGAHGAAPHLSADPIVIAALAILDFQTIVSREIKPVNPAVVTVGSIHGGTKHNIIPDEVRLQLTIRFYSDEVHDQLVNGIERRVSALAQAHRAPKPTVTQLETTPLTVNTPALVARVMPAFEKALGSANVKRVDPVMGAEDFGLFGRDGIPTFMFRIGTGRAEEIAAAKAGRESLPPLHTSRYYPNPKPSLRTGVRAMTAAVCELLPPAGRASSPKVGSAGH